MSGITRFHLGLGALVLALGTLAGSASAASSTDAELIEHGRYLAVVGDCVACHTRPGGKPLAGGLPLQTPFGPIVSSNITPSKTDGIGAYSLRQFADALRKGVRADGAHLYPAMPYTSYALLSDEDVEALYAYFRKGIEPVDASAAPTRLAFPFNIRMLMGVWNTLFLDTRPFQPDPAKSTAWNRGAYLVRGLTHCGDCHTPRNWLMAEDQARYLGGAESDGWWASNITSDPNSGVGAWSEQELVNYLRTGRAGGKAQAGGLMAVAVDDSLRYLNDADLRAIAAYVRTVPPLRDDSDSRPPFAWGEAADDISGIRGESLPSDRDQMSGPQLYDAYCATCHGSGGEGAGSLPSLFHNTALGRTHANNLVMAILKGVRRQPDAPDLLMPGFEQELSDRQITTLAGYLVQRYGNPAAQVTPGLVSELRSGKESSLLLVAARGAIAVAAAAVVIAVVILAFLIVRRWRRRAAVQTP